jgi:hypothetical protein
LCEATRPDAAKAAAAIIDGAELRELGAEVRSDAAIYALEICRLASPGGG